MYNGIFNETSSNKDFFFTISISDEDGFFQISISTGAYESLNNEIRRIIIDEGLFTGVDYPFTIKTNFSTFGSVIEISTQGPVITIAPDESIRDLLGFKATTIFNEYNLSPNPVDILSFGNIYLKCNMAQGRIFKGRRSGLIHYWRMTVDPG